MGGENELYGIWGILDKSGYSKEKYTLPVLLWNRIT